MKEILFWCPYIGKVGTANAVLQSAKALSKSKKFNCKIINVFGEFDEYKNFFRSNKIEVINLINSRILNFIPNEGFIWSRIKFTLIFLFSFIPLLLLLKNKNTYLFIYLLTSLPLLVVKIFKLNTKIIFRVSGKIKFTYFRKLIYLFSRSNILAVLVQTKMAKTKLMKQNIYFSNKIFFIEDPVIDINEINEQKKKKIVNKYKKKKFYVAIGRLTHQKNFTFLVKAFASLQKEHKTLLLIIGEGSKRVEIEEEIKKQKLKKYIHLIGYKDNIYKYIHNSLGLICSSLWEEPGFVIQEAAACKKIIITSDCDSGPSEFLNYGKNGYIYKSNNIKSFIKVFSKMNNENKKHRNMLLNNYKKVHNYTKLNFKKNINQILK